MIRIAERRVLVLLAVFCLLGMVIYPTRKAAAPQTPSELLPIEIDALEALYNATDGAHWTNHTGWLTDPDPCNWYGIDCGSHTWPEVHVINVKLPNNNLTGQIPPEIVNLTQLDELLLNDNHLNGPLPAGMDNFQYIINLCLQNNQLTGPIPPELGNISNSPDGRKLLRLFLFNNQLEGQIPAELGNITSLFYLDLGMNDLTGEIPDTLGNLTNLRELHLALLKLHGEIPPSLANLTIVKFFDLSANQLTGRIPT
jgi:Leucine-rich repeat (LRR) protein